MPLIVRPRTTRIAIAVGVALVTAAAVLAAPAAAATGWTVSPVPDDTRTDGTLAAVDCPTTSVCVATGTSVGDGDSDHGIPAHQVEVVQRSTDGVWQRDQAAVPTSAERPPALNAMSCPTADTCVAVGEVGTTSPTPIIQVATGTTWQSQSVPPLTGRLYASLFAVDCPTATFCLAVGNSWGDPGTQRGYAVAWDGTTWVSLPTPPAPVPQLSSLTGVACTSRTNCYVTGSLNNGDNTASTFLARWNGTAWRVLPAQTGRLTAISCGSATSCTAVGYRGQTPQSFAVTVSGVTTTTHTVATRPGGLALSSVSCPDATHCRATAGAGFARTDDGATWTLGPDLPGPASGISCTAADRCVAVGTDPGADAVTDTSTAAGWDGTTWTTQATADPRTSATDALGNVSCRTLTFCMALDTVLGAPRVFDGSNWRIVAAPAGVVLEDVSCAAPNDCVAVGVRTTPTRSGVSERWSNGAWSETAFAVPRDHLSPVGQSVSCVTVTRCWAVVSDLSPPTLQTWNGRVWKVAAASAALGFQPDAVSCGSLTFCVAVGGAGFAEWDGTTWTKVPTPTDTGTGTYGPPLWDHVSCSADGGCLATGGQQASSDGRANRPVVAFRTATGWEQTSAPTGRPDPDHDRITGVSCVTATACTATLASSQFAARRTSGAARWDGTTWTLQPSPAGAVGTLLADVSCPTLRLCVATGSYVPAGGLTSTYAQIRSV